MLREWVVEGGWLYGYFGEQGLPAGIQECLERFHRRCVDYLSRQFVPKWDCPKINSDKFGPDIKQFPHKKHFFFCIEDLICY